MSPGPRVPLKGFWPLVPAARRKRAMAALGRIVVRLAVEEPLPTGGREVGHDRH